MAATNRRSVGWRVGGAMFGAAVALALPTAVEAAPSLADPASLNEKAPDTFYVKFETTKGDFVVQVNRDWAPNGADRFYNLVKNGFYDGQRFFRVVPGFVAQWGIPADPTIAPAWRSATIRDDPHKEENDLGTVTFATAGPHQRTTQVFINLKLNKELDGRGFTPFGLVVDGMKVVKSLYSGYGDMRSMGGRGPDQAPIQKEGEAYLAREYPKLDAIKSARLM